MAKDREKHIGLRIDSDTWEKFKYVANYEGRSCNGQLKYLINQCITKYEEEYGKLIV